MLLHPDLRLSAFDDHRWVINTSTGHNLLVNNSSVGLFNILQASPSLEQARTQFNQCFRSALSAKAFTRLVYGRFGGYGILAQDESRARPVAAEYLKLRLELLSPAAAAVGAAPLRAFYAPRFFWLTFAALLLFLLAVHLRFASAGAATGPDYWVALPFIYASIFIHEFGHIAACSHFGIRHGGIGFGLYGFLFPVLYADVSNIWQASRQRRIITNLGGIFSQLLYAGLLAGAYLLTAYQPLLLAALATTVMALWQLNPFIRRDGYWLLVDLSNTPNLLAKASRLTRRSLSGAGLRRLVQSRGRVLLSRKVFLLLYGIANTCLLLAFAGYTIYCYGEPLLRFPQVVAALLGKLATGTLSWAELSQVPLVVLAFYVLILRYLVSAFIRWKTRVATPEFLHLPTDGLKRVS